MQEIQAAIPQTTAAPVPITDSSTRLIHEIVARAGAESSQILSLPPLKVEDSPSHSFFEQVQDFVKSTLNWLVSLFPKPSKNALTDSVFIFEVLLIGFGVLLFLSALYFIFKKLKTISRTAPAAQRPEKIVWSRDESLLNELNLAIKSGNLSRASRLRWRVFLMRINAGPAVTPREFFSRRATLPKLETLAYNLMFRGGPNSSGLVDYQSLDTALLGLERSAIKP